MIKNKQHEYIDKTINKTNKNNKTNNPALMYSLSFVYCRRPLNQRYREPTHDSNRESLRIESSLVCT